VCPPLTPQSPTAMTAQQPNSQHPTAAPDPAMSARLAFRLPEHIAQSWRDQAAAAGTSLSDWVRAKVDTAQVTGIAAPAKLPKRRSYTPADPELLRQVAAIGNNLNQLARSVNSRYEAISSVQIISVLSSIRNNLNILIEIRGAKNAD